MLINVPRRRNLWVTENGRRVPGEAGAGYPLDRLPDGEVLAFFPASCLSNQDLSGKRYAVSRELLLHRHGELVSGGDPSSAMPAPDVVARLSSTAPFSRRAQRGVPSPRR